ncbi:hypothetical protein ACFV23_24950 [Streptomyces sp. NPDC059627]
MDEDRRVDGAVEDQGAGLLRGGGGAGVEGVAPQGVELLHDLAGHLRGGDDGHGNVVGLGRVEGADVGQDEAQLEGEDTDDQQDTAHVEGITQFGGEAPCCGGGRLGPVRGGGRGSHGRVFPLLDDAFPLRSWS